MSVFNSFPSTGFYFKVDIAGIGELKCHEVTGIEAELEVEPIKKFNQHHEMLFLPGETKYSDITLKRGYVGNSGLLDWVKAFILNDGRYDQGGSAKMVSSDFKDVTVTLNTAGNIMKVVEWKFLRCFPTKISFSDLNAGKSEIMFESLVLKYSRMEITHHLSAIFS